MNLIKPTFRLWNNKSITAQLGVGFFLLLCFIIIVSFASYLSMHFVRKSDMSIWVSTEIQRLVLEMDRGMENAHFLHSQFFIEYPRIGLKKAHEKYAQKSIRQTAQVVSLSKELQNSISKAKVSETLQKSKVDINLYLSSAKRFADTSIEAVQLVTLLATPETGLTAQLDQHLDRLNTELKGHGLHSDLFHEIERYISKHRITRERFLMQSAFNVSFDLERAIEQNSTLTVPQKDKLNLLLNEIKKISEKILETDVLIKSKFADFSLQKRAADSVSSSLVEMARKEVEKSQKNISTTYTFVQAIMLTICFVALLAAGLIVWLLSTNITKRIIGLTKTAEKFREGNFDVIVEDVSNDELGKLGQTFNFMAVRIKDLVNNLEQKIDQQTKKLQHEKERAQNYLDIAGVMLTGLDTSGKIRLINQKGCEILKTTEQIAIGQDWFEHYLPERMKEEVWGVFNKLMDGDIKPIEYYDNPIVTSTGEERIIAFHNAVLKDSQGNISGVLFSGEDITERKQYEAEREALDLQLRQAQKMEAVGSLAGGIAHDFNNILAVILGYADIAKEDAPPGSKYTSDLDKIIISGNRAKNLVNQILAFSRQSDVVRRPIKLQPLVKEGGKMLRSSIPTTISITDDIDPQAGTVLADPTQVHQILMNLCTNAYHAIGDSGGELGIALKPSFIDSQKGIALGLKEGSYIELTVSDTGTGIGPDILDKIFDPYFTTKEIGKGTGMGLSIIHGIMQEYGGAITIDSQLGQGSTFHVFFPEIQAESFAITDETEELPEGKERILFVDDEELLAEMGKDMLERLGYHVTVRCSSLEALESFQNTPNDFDLVITDQTMPNMTGSDLARRMMQIRSDIPIILCTGYSNLIDEQSAKGLGIKEFALKPLTKDVIAKLIRKVLDN